MADQEAAQVLDRSFLGGLPRELLDELLAGGDRADYPLGTTIYRDGDAPRAMLVLRGLLRVYMTSPEGRQVTVRYARPGDVLGIAAVVGGPADVSVQTLDDVSLFRIDRRILTAAAKRDARVSWALAEELNRRLYETLQQTAVNAFGSVRQRVATHLLDLASAQQRPGAELVARVTQQELSEAVGSSREVVARVLRDLRLEGLVATGSERIRVLDPAALQEQCWSSAG
ncbi:MAG TPA: Crp/Fnr family transcriptional regulator [Nocardioides sp.]|uniref:Crp/Fnr family transcriptional regulator n=1 Tax=Nocardioides sp. TaxID=35761 RepID=UPI002E36BF2A|nr:Crp/Fnr family transcriptional regulator [Nocardioides sp.]HEX5088687.1 Crp/Fnr family transcriptional regulator [Nocardioides sp.]